MIKPSGLYQVEFILSCKNFETASKFAQEIAEKNKNFQIKITRIEEVFDMSEVTG